MDALEITGIVGLSALRIFICVAGVFLKKIMTFSTKLTAYCVLAHKTIRFRPSDCLQKVCVCVCVFVCV